MTNPAEVRHERLLWGKTTEFLGASEAIEGLLSIQLMTPNTISDMLDAVRAEHANGDDTEHDRDCGD